MNLSLQSFATMVQNGAAAAQAACAQALDFTVGGVLRALMEANAALALWLQWLILQVLAMTRASTSTGADLDSWMADWSLTREAAIPATGSATFSRYTSATAALIVPGAQVKTLDGTQTFAVLMDFTNPLWNTAQGGYLVPAGMASATVPVQAVTAGSGGNIAAGTIGLLASAIPGIDTITNALAFTTGRDAETDAALRARFAAYIGALARATPAAIQYAAQSVQQGLTVAIAENQDTSGAYRPGWAVVTVDDGTGAPPASLIANVQAAVNAYRALGVVVAVQGPVVTRANVSVALALGAGVSRTAVEAAVSAAITAYINGLTVGQTLSYTRLAQVIFDSIAGITDITTLTINGAAASLTVPANGVVRPGTVAVN